MAQACSSKMVSFQTNSAAMLVEGDKQGALSSFLVITLGSFRNRGLEK